MAPSQAMEVSESGQTAMTKKKKEAVKDKLGVLPVSRKIRTLLQDLQKDVQPALRESKIQAIVHTVIADNEGIESKASQYILKRLITGVASSVGYARTNYSFVLMRLAREHPASIDVIYANVLKVYGDNGKFNAEYSRGVMEKTLGSVAATASVVRGSGKKKIPSDCARDMLRLLRQSVTGEARKWNLTPAVMDVVRELLVNLDDIDQLKKPLWKWAEDRKLSRDGLTLALLLVLEYELFPHESIGKLYPSLAAVSKPLMAIFETGFPRKPSKNQFNSKSLGRLTGSKSNFLTWCLMLMYCSSEKGKSHFGGVSAFWEKCVVPNLITPANNQEKNLLVRELMPIAVSHLELDSKPELMLNATLLSKIGNVASKRKQKQPNASELESGLPMELSRICSDEKLSESRRLFLVENLLRWIATNVSHHLGGEKLVADIPQTLPESAANEVFLKLVHCFLLPELTSAVAVDKSRCCFLSMLERISTVHPQLTSLLTLTVLKITAFVDPKSKDAKKLFSDEPTSEDPIPLTPVPAKALKKLRKTAKETLGCGFSDSLPTPQPALSNETAQRMFNRMVEFLLKAQRAGIVAERFATASNIVTAAIQNGWKLRCDSEDEVSTLSESLDQSMNKLQEEKDDIPAGAANCLLLIGNFLRLYLCQPELNSDESSFATSTEDILQSFTKTVNAVVHPESADEDDDVPEPLQQVAHLLCVMSAGNSRLAGVARHCASLLGESSDDAVFAALFDLLDRAKKGESLAVDEDEADDNDEDSVEEFSVDEDENEEDYDADEVMMALPEDRDDPSNEPVTNVDDADSDILDADVDPDSEDPALLAAFDNHLSNHMKLLVQEKSKARKERVQAKEKIERIINLIAAVTNSLRLSVERSNAKKNKKNVAVFFDVFVRFVEFVYNPEFNGAQHAKRVAAICDKNLSRKQIFGDGLNGLDELIKEFEARLSTAVASGAKQRRDRVHEFASVARRLQAIVKDSSSEKESETIDVDDEGEDEAESVQKSTKTEGNTKPKKLPKKRAVEKPKTPKNKKSKR